MISKTERMVINNIIDKVETIVYSIEYVPDVEDYDINDYDSEDEMKEDMLYAYTFNIDFYDLYGEHLNEYLPNPYMTFDYVEVCEIFNEEIANEMVNSMGYKRSNSEYELTIGANTKPKSMSIEDVDEVAKRILPIVDEYYKGCRGFILYDGTIVNTESEHNMVTAIEGINSKFDFIKLGNIRILADSIDVWKSPTRQQRNVLRIVINHFNNDTLYLDIDSHPVKYFNPDYQQVLGDIDRYFNEGLKPFSRNKINEDKKEVTYYQFSSHVQNFLSKLKDKPTQAKPSKFLEDNGFAKEKLIRILIKRNILRRKESIKDPTNSDEKKAKYYVKYTIIRNGFEDKMKKFYNDYFGKEVLTECDCGGCMGGATEGGGATNCDSVGGQYTVPFGGVQYRKSYLSTRKKDKKVPKPENILGKTVSENTKKRKIKITESQMNYILEKQGLDETTTTFSVGAETSRGDMGYDAPAFIDKETAERKPGFSCKTSPVQLKKSKK
jgi:hypothetical protein